MRVARIRLQRFRGYLATEIAADSHVVVVGEPRAGRSDLIAALRRVLDPRSTSGRVNPLDIHRPFPDGEEDTPLTEVEVALLDLGPDLEQLLSNHLELFDPSTGVVAGEDKVDEAVLGVRLCYRARYDDESDTGDHWVDWPAQSDPPSGTFSRARRVEREALPFLLLTSGAPLQVRAEGVFRSLIEDANPNDLSEAIRELESSVTDAADEFSGTSSIADTLSKVLAAGAGSLLQIDEPSHVTFGPDDGSIAGLLRAMQPLVDLDAAGFLPIASHGSTASAVLSASEAVVAAREAESGLVIAVDDFGDGLDSAAAEYLAILLRRDTEQVWISTRRPEVLRAFEPEEILRLTRRGGNRHQFRLAATTDRKARRARRDLLDQLMNAITARTVVLTEGPHDVEGYGSLAARLAKVRPRRTSYPVLAAHSTRLVCAPGQSGGKDQLPALASLAGDLGFEVRAVVDDDKPGENDDLYDELEALTAQLVVLPERTAVEVALVRGLKPEVLRLALENLVEAYDLDLDVDDIEDDDLEATIIKKKVLKAKGGLHRPWVESLSKTRPPRIALRVLRAICSVPQGRLVLDDDD